MIVCFLCCCFFFFFTFHDISRLFRIGVVIGNITNRSLVYSRRVVKTTHGNITVGLLADRVSTWCHGQPAFCPHLTFPQSDQLLHVDCSEKPHTTNVRRLDITEFHPILSTFHSCLPKAIANSSISYEHSIWFNLNPVTSHLCAWPYLTPP